MQGKTKSFFEDTIIVLVLLVVGSIGFFIYDKYSNENHIEKMLDDTTLTVEKFFTELKDLPTEIKEFILKEKEVIDQIRQEPLIDLNATDTNQSIIEIEENIDTNTTLEIQKSKEVLENIQPIVEKKAEPKPEIIKEKKVDLKMLKTFLDDLELKLTNSIVQNIDSNETKSLRYRITVLKDGNYEQLTFVGGDKVLFEENQDNIIKVFPVTIDEKIKDEFPRYIRLNIK